MNLEFGFCVLYKATTLSPATTTVAFHRNIDDYCDDKDVKWSVRYIHVLNNFLNLINKLREVRQFISRFSTFALYQNHLSVFKKITPAHWIWISWVGVWHLYNFRNSTGDSNVKQGWVLCVHLILFQCQRELSKVVVSFEGFLFGGQRGVLYPPLKVLLWYTLK